jgi:hypothetical protein
MTKSMAEHQRRLMLEAKDIRETLAAADAVKTAISDWGDLDALPMRRSDAMAILHQNTFAADTEELVMPQTANTTVTLMRLCDKDGALSHIGYSRIAMFSGYATVSRERWFEVVQWMGEGCAVSFGANGTQLIVANAIERYTLPLAKRLS